MALLFATLLLPRAHRAASEPAWFAWPGYIWFGLVVYLFLTLLALEPVRLALLAWVKRKPPPAAEPAASARIEPTTVPRPRRCRGGGGGVGRAWSGPVWPTRSAHPTCSRFRCGCADSIRRSTVFGSLSWRTSTSDRWRARAHRTDRPDDQRDGAGSRGHRGRPGGRDRRELGSAAEPLRDLVSREGAFFVTGNHEYFVHDTSAWLRELERLGVHPLRNENTAIRRGSATFDLAGVNDVAGATALGSPGFRSCAGRRRLRPGRRFCLPTNRFRCEEAAARGVDLQLSGHTHGGQMWPFHYIVRAVQPSLAGLSTVDNTQLYVTRGAGFWGPPVRIGAPAGHHRAVARAPESSPLPRRARARRLPSCMAATRATGMVRPCSIKSLGRRCRFGHRLGPRITSAECVDRRVHGEIGGVDPVQVRPVQGKRNRRAGRRRGL